MRLSNETLLDIRTRRDSDIDIALLLNHINDVEAKSMAVSIERIERLNDALGALEAKIAMIEEKIDSLKEPVKIKFEIVGAGGDGRPAVGNTGGTAGGPGITNLFAKAKSSSA